MDYQFQKIETVRHVGNCKFVISYLSDRYKMPFRRRARGYKRKPRRVMPMRRRGRIMGFRPHVPYLRKPIQVLY